MSKQLVIIPVYNEQATIAAVLSELQQHYREDVLVVNDGSTDDSIEMVRQLQRSRLQVLSHPENAGYGLALIDGLQYAHENGYSAAVTMDCDAQHEPCLVPRLFAGLEGCDVLSGSRYLRENDTDYTPPRDRLRINRMITEEINRITGFALTDAFCGFKAYRIAALQPLELDEAGYAFPLQFWIQAAAHGLRVREIAVSRIYLHLDRSFGVELDDPTQRLAYYRAVIKREVERWQLT